MSHYGTLPLLPFKDINNVVPKSSKEQRASVQSIRHFRSQQRERHLDSWVLLPSSPFLHTWDIIIAFALCWTATVSVFDICVVESREVQKEVLAFLLTACFDVIFISDTCITFFRAYLYKHRGAHLLETNLRTIQRHYLFSLTFIVDLLSSIPFDVIVQLLQTAGVHVRHFRLLRLLRLLRLARMWRILRRSSVWKQFVLRTNSATVSLVRLGSLIILVNHWFACIVVFLAREEDYKNSDRNTWLTAYSESLKEPIDLESDFQVYILGLYWGVMSVTSVGYGDIVPVVLEEHMVLIVLLLLGGFLWTYIIGQVSGLVMVMEQDKRERYKRLDDVNAAMRHALSPLSSVEQERVREFMYELTHSHAFRLVDQLAAIDLLSPQLKSVVLLGHFGGALKRLWVLRGGVSTESLAFLASRVTVLNFAKYERFDIRASIVYINAGTCIVDNPTKINNIDNVGISTRISRMTALSRQAAGEQSFMGRECVIEEGKEMRVKGRAASFVEFFAIARSDLYAAAEHDLILQDRLKRARCWVNLLRWAQSVLNNSNDSNTTAPPPQDKHL